MSAADDERHAGGGVIEGAYSVAVGPVTVPDLVDRPQMVVRVAPNQVKIVEGHRWAQPLASDIARAVAGDLGKLLSSARPSSSAASTSADADYRILLDLMRFDATLGDAVSIDAQWELRSRADGKRKMGRSHIHQAVGGPGYDSLVSAYADALASVSRDIAREILALRAVR